MLLTIARYQTPQNTVTISKFPVSLLLQGIKYQDNKKYQFTFYVKTMYLFISFLFVTKEVTRIQCLVLY